MATTHSIERTRESIQRLLTEDLLTVTEARGELATLTRRRPDKATMHRWIHRGVGGVKLEAARLGNQWFTSRQALTRFIEQRSATR